MKLSFGKLIRWDWVVDRANFLDFYNIVDREALIKRKAYEGGRENVQQIRSVLNLA